MKPVLAKFALGLSLCLATLPSRAAELTWLTDLPQAQAQAKAEKRDVLLFFHGSDWSPPCVEMQRDVFGSPEFAAYARQARRLQGMGQGGYFTMRRAPDTYQARTVNRQKASGGKSFSVPCLDRPPDGNSGLFSKPALIFQLENLDGAEGGGVFVFGEQDGAGDFIAEAG